MADADDGTWRYRWPAGERLLAEFAEVIAVRGRRVIDLGCGQGRLGRKALAEGAAAVLFADRSAEALAAIPAHPAARTLVHRWGEPLPPCDILLGGDILYRSALFPDLLRSVASALPPGAVAWLADPRSRLEDELPMLCFDNGLRCEPQRRPSGYTLVRVTPLAG